MADCGKRVLRAGGVRRGLVPRGGRRGRGALTEKTRQDLLAYLEEGGSLLLSGAAGRLLNDLAIEPTPLRVLGPTEAAFLTGIRVGPEHRSHPAFAGLDTTKPILLTSLGGNALADFLRHAGPHGQLLAEGNAGQGERPLVEYSVGRGRVIFVGWRLPDFTTAGDPLSTEPGAALSQPAGLPGPREYEPRPDGPTGGKIAVHAGPGRALAPRGEALRSKPDPAARRSLGRDPHSGIGGRRFPDRWCDGLARCRWEANR